MAAAVNVRGDDRALMKSIFNHQSLAELLHLNKCISSYTLRAMPSVTSQAYSLQSLRDARTIKKLFNEHLVACYCIADTEGLII